MANDLNGKELLVRHITNADRTVLRELADLAERLGFESPKIITLKENPTQLMREARQEIPNLYSLRMVPG